jgi:acetoin utilization protein AcuB
MTPLLVRDFMSTAVTTITDDAHLLDAALLLRRTGKRQLPVVNSTGRTVGILTDGDLRLLTPSALTPVSAEEQNRIFRETPITAAMTKNPVSVLPDDTVSHAIELMQDRRIQYVVVEEKSKLCGIFTVSDVLQCAKQLLREREGTVVQEVALSAD